MRSSKVFALVVVVGVVGPVACDSPSKPSEETTTFQGTVAGGGGQTGTLNITVQAKVARLSIPNLLPSLVATLHAQADTVTVSGTLRFAGGSTTALTGTFNTSTKAITLSGGGFTFTGTQSGAVISGTYTGPNGATGAFSSRNTSSGTVTVYCGTGTAGGVFNLVVSDASGAVSGAFTITTDSPPTLGSITGQVTGTALSLVFTATAGRFAGETITGTGSIQGGSVSGTIADGNTFSGSTSACQ